MLPHNGRMKTPTMNGCRRSPCGSGGGASIASEPSGKIRSEPNSKSRVQLNPARLSLTVPRLSNRPCFQLPCPWLPRLLTSSSRPPRGPSARHYRVTAMPRPISKPFMLSIPATWTRGQE